VPEMWEQERLRCAGPRLRGDIKEEACPISRFGDVQS